MALAAAPRIRLTEGELEARVCLAPLAIDVVRAGRPIACGIAPWVVHGRAADHFVQLTEGVLPAEEIERTSTAGSADVTYAAPGSVILSGQLSHREQFSLSIEIEAERVVLELDVGTAPLRAGFAWAGAEEERITGLGARHGTCFDQCGRSVRLGADRRYTGPDCPPDMLDVGGIPQGDYAPVPWALSSAGWAAWLETEGDAARFDLGAEPPAPGVPAGRAVAVSQRTAAGPLRLHFLTDPHPAARLRRYLRLTGMPTLLPEWAYGHWKSRDVYEHQRDVEDDYEGYRRNDLPLDAIVIDSPWETQYNTWEFNPHQFPDAPGLIRRMRDDGVRTVVWVTPWVNLESVDGQRPPDAESERLHREPAPNYAEAAEAGHFVKTADGEPFVARWWMGTGSPVDFTSPAADDWWREQARRVIGLGVEGIKADDGEGYYFPPEVRFTDGRGGAQAAWGYGGLYRASMQRALDEAAPGRGVVFGRSGWSGQQRHGITWGGDQASDFWSLRTLVAATLTAAASGFSNWSHDVGGYLGKLLVERCPKELLLRWVQFGCFTPLFQSHGRFEQEAWTYDEETLDVYRDYVLLHERLVPYVRAAARTAAVCGLPICRPLCLTDPDDARAWEIPDAYGYGPALWIAPVLDEGAREREVPLPRGEWIDLWTRERVEGGGTITARAPLDRVPAWVRSGSIVVTHPAGHVARGLGDTPEGERPLEATLWGEPALGHASARLADGTRLGWRDGDWSVRDAGEREIRFRSIG